MAKCVAKIASNANTMRSMSYSAWLNALRFDSPAATEKIRETHQLRIDQNHRLLFILEMKSLDR